MVVYLLNTSLYFYVFKLSRCVTIQTTCPRQNLKEFVFYLAKKRSLFGVAEDGTTFRIFASISAGMLILLVWMFLIHFVHQKRTQHDDQVDNYENNFVEKG